VGDRNGIGDDTSVGTVIGVKLGGCTVGDGCSGGSVTPITGVAVSAITSDGTGVSEARIEVGGWVVWIVGLAAGATAVVLSVVSSPPEASPSTDGAGVGLLTGVESSASALALVGPKVGRLLKGCVGLRSLIKGSRRMIHACCSGSRLRKTTGVTITRSMIRLVQTSMLNPEQPSAHFTQFDRLIEGLNGFFFLRGI
jgi:hypothetical protein